MKPKHTHDTIMTTVALATRLSASSGEVRLARGLSAPSCEVRLAQGLNDPSRVPARTTPRSCSHVRAFNALTPQDCATTPTRVGILPRCYCTNSHGAAIPATVQRCAKRPVSAP
jgi:hypothetical protein